MKILRALILLAALAFLAYAAALRTEVHDLGEDGTKTYAGGDFNEAATTDSLLRKDGKLYDGNSLTPERASVKDCPT